jgi:uncharacterized protein (UPF0276 family)
MRQDRQLRSLSRWSHGPIPARAGVGLKPEHYDIILETRPDLGWFEVHPENYMGEGGAPHYYLSRIRAQYPISFHGVGLSIGSSGPIDKRHRSLRAGDVLRASRLVDPRRDLSQ